MFFSPFITTYIKKGVFLLGLFAIAFGGLVVLPEKTEAISAEASYPPISEIHVRTASHYSAPAANIATDKTTVAPGESFNLSWSFTQPRRIEGYKYVDQYFGHMVVPGPWGYYGNAYYAQWYRPTSLGRSVTIHSDPSYVNPFPNSSWGIFAMNTFTFNNLDPVCTTTGTGFLKKTTCRSPIYISPESDVPDVNWTPNLRYANYLQTIYSTPNPMPKYSSPEWYEYYASFTTQDAPLAYVAYGCSSSGFTIPSQTQPTRALGNRTGASAGTISITPTTGGQYCVTCGVTCGYGEACAQDSPGPSTSCVNISVVDELQVSCTPSPTSATTGQSVTWTATPTGGTGTYTYVWSGTNNLSGTTRTVQKTYTTTGTKSGSVTVTSGGVSKTSSCSSTVAVSDPTPTASLSANPSSILKGQSATLTWTSANTTSCSGQGFSTGGATSGTRSVSPSNITNYGISCATSGADIHRTTTVTVLEPTASISASSNRVNVGDTITVSWNAENVESCSINGPGISLTSPAGTNGVVSGSQEVVITQQSTYIISCSPGGTNAQSATIVNIIPTFEEF